MFRTRLAPMLTTALMLLAATVRAQGTGMPTSNLGKADRVDWNRAWESPGSYSGDFSRAQWLMARLASAAYASDSAADSQLAEDGFRRTASVHEGSLDAIAGTSGSGSMNFIAIRGTSAVDDVLVDVLNIPIDSYASGDRQVTVHAGFSNTGRGAANALRDAVAGSCGGGRAPLWITGHSLGAAAAAVAALELVNQGCYVAGVVLLGSPRPGLRTFREVYHSTFVEGVNLGVRTQRWLTSHDPVYCLPPGGGWAHVGIESLVDGQQPNAATDSQCNSPIALINSLRGGLDPYEIIRLINAPQALSAALLDFFAGLIDLTLQCEAGIGWDDLWSLGACTAVEVTDRLQAFNVTPTELFTAVLRGAWAAEHLPSEYVNGLGAVDWSDGLQWVTLRVTLDIAGVQRGEYSMFEATTSQVCDPLPDPDGYFACDFQVPIGFSIQLTLTGPGVQFLSADGCEQYLAPLGSTVPVCGTLVRGPMGVTYRDLGTVP